MSQPSNENPHRVRFPVTSPVPSWEVSYWTMDGSTASGRDGSEMAIVSYFATGVGYCEIERYDLKKQQGHLRNMLRALESVYNNGMAHKARQIRSMLDI
jgi:hypothetical protein